jgi:hypothetical protein
MLIDSCPCAWEEHVFIVLSSALGYRLSITFMLSLLQSDSQNIPHRRATSSITI